ncbi:hypothetical protein MUN82_08615 [Hymenobacter aerilatus]|uniref:DUF4349 domain-containing protein n=1 Tax=Hymenobacter aerilatus TaxID=2932251 RepID=A0A8T9SZ52_9BACT|nr:hypothetical protein [Hymenobacter aerilatus]UOR07145.1 hypothetical protein MUN82_08615 [Hymenobacter aerilatus]
MKYLAYLLSFCLLLSSCSAEKRALQKAKKAPVSTTYDLPRPAKGDTARITVTPPPRTAVGGIISAVTGRDKPTVTPAGNIILPKKNYGSISISTGSGSSSASVAGKKAAAAVGEGATTTSIGKVKAPTAVGDSNQLSTAGKNGIVGDGNTVTTKEAAGWKVYAFWALVVGGALVGWYFLAPVIAWLPSRERLLGWAGYGKKKNDTTA